jgi:hypothetical protein
MANPESVEKMQVVVDSLRSNPDVVVVGGFERNYLQTGDWPQPNGYWSRTLDIFTHPVEPIYEADELNDFMFGLVPELEATCSDRFRGGKGPEAHGLALGKLYYDESIGTAALSATIQLKEGISLVNSGVVDSEWNAGRTLDLQQRTWLRVYPDKGHLLDAAEGQNLYDIPRDDLGRRHAAGRVVAALFEAPMLGGVVQGGVVEPRALEA